jgi:hypothetical protein
MTAALLGLAAWSGRLLIALRVPERGMPGLGVNAPRGKLALPSR